VGVKRGRIRVWSARSRQRYGLQHSCCCFLTPPIRVTRRRELSSGRQTSRQRGSGLSLAWLDLKMVLFQWSNILEGLNFEWASSRASRFARSTWSCGSPASLPKLGRFHCAASRTSRFACCRRLASCGSVSAPRASIPSVVLPPSPFLCSSVAGAGAITGAVCCAGRSLQPHLATLLALLRSASAATLRPVLFLPYGSFRA